MLFVKLSSRQCNAQHTNINLNSSRTHHPQFKDEDIRANNLIYLQRQNKFKFCQGFTDINSFIFFDQFGLNWLFIPASWEFSKNNINKVIWYREILWQPIRQIVSPVWLLKRIRVLVFLSRVHRHKIR